MSLRPHLEVSYVLEGLIKNGVPSVGDGQVQPTRSFAEISRAVCFTEQPDLHHMIGGRPNANRCWEADALIPGRRF